MNFVKYLSLLRNHSEKDIDFRKHKLLIIEVLHLIILVGIIILLIIYA